MSVEIATRKVMVSEWLAATLDFRTLDGYRLSVEWGEPDEDGFYTPTITRHYDDRLGELDEAWREAEAALPEGGWTGPDLYQTGEGWYAAAGATPMDEWDARYAEAVGSTPVEALRILASKLRGER